MKWIERKIQRVRWKVQTFSDLLITILVSQDMYLGPFWGEVKARRVRGY